MKSACRSEPEWAKKIQVKDTGQVKNLDWAHEAGLMLFVHVALSPLFFRNFNIFCAVISLLP
jgi:hypothetical protein